MATKQPDGEVFDLDAFVAEAKAPARPDFHFRFGGEDFVLPGHPDVFALMDIEHGRLESGLRKLISQVGDNQWARMEASDAVMDPPRLNALIERYGKHLGQALGEAQASPGSSPSTARRSKRTSNGTTTFR